MSQLKWWMALIGLLILGGQGAIWAVEEAAAMGVTQANAAALFAQCRAVAAAIHSNLRNGPTKM